MRGPVVLAPGVDRESGANSAAAYTATLELEDAIPHIETGDAEERKRRVMARAQVRSAAEDRKDPKAILLMPGRHRIHTAQHVCAAPHADDLTLAHQPGDLVGAHSDPCRITNSECALLRHRRCLESPVHRHSMSRIAQPRRSFPHPPSALG